MATCKIVIGADLVPTESNLEYFEKGDIDTLVGEALKDELFSADFRVFNFEAPIAERENPISKCGPNLSVSSRSIKGISALRPDLLVLANNHILDHGEEALFFTQSLFDSNKINYIGAGSNLEDASKPFILNHANMKVGFYACAEHEFTIVTNKGAGANPFDPLESLDHISELKQQCDYVIVLFHGGREHYRYPSPNTQKICRKMVEKGSNLVICQHTHCIGCEERYSGGVIVYGQGNFLFDYSNHECWQTSLLVKCSISRGDFAIGYIPIIKQNSTVRRAIGVQKEEILNGFFTRTEEIKGDGVIENKYSEHAKSNINQYYRYFLGTLGNNFIYRALNRLTKYKLNALFFNSTQSRNYIKACLDCESHREFILAGIKQQKNP